MTNDPIREQLTNLSAPPPAPRTDLSEQEKDELIQKVGGHLTTESILKARKDYPKSRIPFLFNSLDPQAVVDILHNDMSAAIDRAREGKRREKSGKPPPT
jgi:hypothetical protein